MDGGSVTMKSSERARLIAERFHRDPDVREELEQAIREAITESQRETQAWRPLEVKSSSGRMATILLHCDETGCEIQAFNPIRGDYSVLRLKPMRKPAGRSEQTDSRGEGHSSHAPRLQGGAKRA